MLTPQLILLIVALVLAVVDGIQSRSLLAASVILVILALLFRG